jgi:hypothetical protein
MVAQKSRTTRARNRIERDVIDGGSRARKERCWGGCTTSTTLLCFLILNPVAHRASRPAAIGSVVDGEPNKLFTLGEAFKLSTFV